jgi:hypothetical protein
MIRTSKIVFFFLVILLVCAAALAAQQSSDGAVPSGISLPLVSFTFDFPQSTPAHYIVTIDKTGKALYESGEAPKSADQADDSFRYEFQVSELTRKQIFDLSQRAHYFEGNFEQGKGKIANTGMKKLTYRDEQNNGSATFNYTADPAAQELTRIFQSISATMQFAERLEYFHRYQKLALDDEMKRMEEMVKGKSLMEVQAIAPILKQIIADQTVVNATRARAERILLTVNMPSR